MHPRPLHFQAKLIQKTLILSTKAKQLSSHLEIQKRNIKKNQLHVQTVSPKEQSAPQPREILVIEKLDECGLDIEFWVPKLQEYGLSKLKQFKYFVINNNLKYTNVLSLNGKVMHGMTILRVYLIL